MALTKEEVYTALRGCVDPEIPVNIVDLGLIYSVDLRPSSASAEQCEVVVKMTLTSPGCPMSQTISHEVHRRLLDLPQVSQARVEIVWEPLWSPERITPEGRRHLQLN
jgi:metal-sulfur cluster biosynthetic enzyme